MVRWVLVRLHCSVSEPSTGSVACSEGLIDGSVEEGGGHGSASAEATTLAALVGGSLLEGVNNQPGWGGGGLRQKLPSTLCAKREEEWSRSVGGTISGTSRLDFSFCTEGEKWDQIQGSAGCETDESSVQMKNNCIKRIPEMPKLL